MKTNTKRVIAANSNHCCIYDYHVKKNQLTLIKEIDHPENRLKKIALLSDKPGHYKASQNNRGSFSADSDACKVNIDNFMRQLALELDSERNHHDFTELVLIMSPYIEGRLNQHMTKQVKRLIECCIQKNLMNCSEKELLHYLHQHLIEKKKSLH